MLKSTNNLQLVKAKLRELCEKYLNCQASNNQTESKHTSLAISNANEATVDDNSAAPATQGEYKCRICRRNSQSRAIQCDQCSMCVHYRNEKLTESEINKLESTCTPLFCRASLRRNRPSLHKWCYM